MIFLDLRKRLLDKKGEAVAGLAVCLTIILVAFSLIQMVLTLNTHYKLTRRLEHTFTVAQTAAIQGGGVYLGFGTDIDELVSEIMGEAAVAAWSELAWMEYEVEESGEDFYIFNIDGQKLKVSGFDYDYKVERAPRNDSVNPDNTALKVTTNVRMNVEYVFNTILSDEPLTVKTDPIEFSTTVQFVDDYTGNTQQHWNNSNTDNSKYEDR